MCHHVVAEHNYTFEVDDVEQTFAMSCALCGKGSNHVPLTRGLNGHQVRS
jgi:hypothetical protein